MRRRRRATPAAAPRRSRAAAALVLAAIAVLVSAVSATGPFGALVPRRALKQDLLAAETTTSSSAASCLTCDTLETCIKARFLSLHCAPAVPSQYGSNDLNSPSELPLSITDPGFDGKVFWNARQQGGAWGGYFRILPPSSPGAVLNLGICAGCGQNVPGKGYYVGTGFSITFNNYAEAYSSITVKALPAGDTADIEGMQVYLSFIAPPGLNPGSFKTFTDYGPPVAPSSPLTAFPSTFFANAKDNVTYKDGSTTYTVPYNSVNPAEGLFLALHFDVVQYCSS